MDEEAGWRLELIERGRQREGGCKLKLLGDAELLLLLLRRHKQRSLNSTFTHIKAQLWVQYPHSDTCISILFFFYFLNNFTTNEQEQHLVTDLPNFQDTGH